jgi:hypothetical protein
MEKITLYRFNRPDGGVSVSPVKPDGDYTELFRLVADEGMVLTDGKTVTSCTDTENPGAWSEVSDPDLSEVEEKAAAYDIITGVSE